jgi:uncharacterized protein with HEPN domain
MLPKTLELLKDMRQTVRDLIALVRGKSIDMYRADHQFRCAVERGIDSIGEVLAQLRSIDPTRAQAITDRRAVIGFGSALTEGRAERDPDRTWRIAHRELPMLLHELETLLS